MKKALINGFLGIAFAFAMVACNGNATTEDTIADTTGATMEQACMHHCQMTCPDSVCLAANCENCACPDSSACRQKPQCKGDGQCCKEKADGQCCKEKAAAEGQCCKEQGEGCKKECESHK